MNVEETLERIIDSFWEESQIDMAVEESSELIQALQKFKRLNSWQLQDKKEHIIDNVFEEIADMVIMIWLLKKIFWKEDLIDSKIQEKLKRIEPYLDKVEE